MRRFEVLLDVLEKEGFTGLREKMEERENEISRGSTFRRILTTEEIKLVKKTLKEIKIPKPTGWAHAMMVHEMRDNVKNFSEDKVYNYTELCNLSTTLHEVGLNETEIWRKIEDAKNSLKRYDPALRRDY